MQIFLDNFSWMVPNASLAAIGFIFAFGYLRSKSIFLQAPMFVLWLLFMPNTIYLLTDIQYLPKQLLRVDYFGVLLLLFQYGVLMILGFLTYFAAMLPVQSFFKRSKAKKANYNYFFVLINFAAAFAVVLGKVERTHSWYLFTQPLRVIKDISHVLATPLLVLSVAILGIFFNLIYFRFRNQLKLFR